MTACGYVSGHPGFDAVDVLGQAYIRWLYQGFQRHWDDNGNLFVKYNVSELHHTGKNEYTFQVPVN